MSDVSAESSSEFETSEDDFDLESDENSESSESEEEPENFHLNGGYPWFRVLQPEPCNRDGHIFNQNVGVKEMPPANSKPITYFYLLFTLEFIQRIVQETNRYASDFIASRNRIGRFSRLHEWYKIGPTTLSEIKAFLSVILNMGLIRKPSISEYWNSMLPSQKTPWFQKMFSRNRFQNLLKFFHLVNNNAIPARHDENYSPTDKFQCIVDLLNTQSKKHYVPEQILSVDESLIGTRGRTAILQYIPSKTAKFGVKLWLITESMTDFMFHTIVYKGRRYDPTPPDTTQGSHVINTLLQCSHLLNKYYHVVCDNFFTSIKLARELLLARTYLTGTLRVNRAMPNMIKNANLRENEHVYARQGQLLLCGYRQTGRKRSVRLLSTQISAINNNQGKPNVVTFYNKYMGGVDLADAMVAHYYDDRKTLKVWKKVIFNLLQRFVINAYILYSKHSSERPLKTRLQFLQSVIEDLAAEHLERRADNNVNERPNRNRRISIRKLPAGKVKECCVCSDRTGFGGRHRSSTACPWCGLGLHKNCIANHICVEP